MSSNAVGLEYASRVVGYKITKGDFSETSPNLPQRIAIIGEANTAQQAGLSTDPVQVTTAQQGGVLFGYGSPIHQQLRILFPVSGEGVGGIPVVVYPQAAAVGSTARIQTITVTGTPTGSGVHTLIIAGRRGLDGVPYDINIVKEDTPTTIAAKISDAINSVLGCPVSGSPALGVVTCPTKWTGLTAQSVTIEVSNNNNPLGITYAVAQTTPGAGTPSIAASLQKFGNEWNTIVLNSYGAESGILDALEAYNGIPDPVNPTGRYSGIVMSPFIALTGSVLENPTTVTDGRLNNVTIAICPAPLSPGLHWEAAANMAVLFARVSQNTPHLDVAGMAYPDMPVPASIGFMATYVNRNLCVKKGCSTATLVTGRYIIQDFVTTYHPIGEEPPQFRYCRNLMLDFNVRFGYYLLEQRYVVPCAIANDSSIVVVANVIKPKQWKQVISAYAEDLERRALISEKEFTQASIQVNIGTNNPDRFESFFRYKRTGFARISSTTAEAGFSFGSLN
jgi:phage tail sheath gpL-like